MAKQSKPTRPSGNAPKVSAPKPTPPIVQFPKEEKPKPARNIVKHLKESLLRREAMRAKSSNYFIQDEIFGRGRKLPIPRQNVKTTRPTIMAFADDAPLYNWAHPCRYLLHDAESGELYQEVGASFPPYAGGVATPKNFISFHEPLKHIKPDIFRLTSRIVVKQVYRGNRYAVLFSGMSNNRHTNDLEFLYRTLRDNYGLPEENIYVLNQDGSVNYDGDPQPVVRWPGDNSAYRMPVHGKGSKADLLGVLDDLKARLESNDTLLIHTNNHGGHDGTESYLCCYPNWDSLGVTDFTNKLAELPRIRSLMVMMEQCHSGGFNAQVLAQSTAVSTSIASACEELQNSMGGWYFDPFAYDWISAMTGVNPYGYALTTDPDADTSGRVSAREAFNFAYSVRNPGDTPVFADANHGGDRWIEGAP